jgi:hypothetical protein
MAANTPSQIVIFFACSLLFTSVVLSWVVLQAYGISVAGIPFETLAGNSNIDLSGSSGYEEIGGAWVYDANSGKVSSASDSYLVFSGLKASNEAKYTNTYNVLNPNQEDYSIVLSYSLLRTQEVIVSSDGFHVVEHTIGLSDLTGDRELYFYPYEGANSLTDTKITTALNIAALVETNTQDNILDFYMNNNLIFSVPQSDELFGEWGSQMEIVTDVYYGGIGSKDNIGVSLKSFSSDSTGSSATLDSLTAYFWTLLKMLVWNIDTQYCPWEINLLLIKSQEFALGVGILGIFWK